MENSAQALLSPKTNQRLHTIDTLRGIAMCYVMLYHLLFDLALTDMASYGWIFDPPMEFTRRVVVAILVLISGFSVHLSRNNYKRGLKTLAVAMLLSAVTFLVTPELFIAFGILHFMGCMMLLAPLLRPLTRRLSWATGFILPIAFLLLFTLPRGYLIFPTFSLPDFLYQNPLGFILGFPTASFSSSDYYPLLPWGLLYLFGAHLGDFYHQHGFPDCLYGFKSRFFAYIGRHSLMLYLLHQPLFIAILWVVSALTRL